MDDVKRPPEEPKAEDLAKSSDENQKPIINDVVLQKSEPKAQVTESEQGPETASNEETIKPAPSRNEQEAPKPKKKRNFLPIFLAVVVMSCLIGVAVYAGFFIKDNANSNYKSSNNNSAETTSDSSSQSANLATDTKKEINDALKEINSISEEDDTSGSNLSDQSLGL